MGAGYGSSGGTFGAGITEKNFLGKGINLNTNIELTDESLKVNLYIVNLILIIQIILYLLLLEQLQLIVWKILVTKFLI